MTLGQQAQALIEKLQYRYNRVFHYQECPFGPGYQRYWDRRYAYFSKFDQGIKTDAEGLHSVTPEKIAKEIAAQVKSESVVDAFCGIGGNAIAFAKVCDKVYVFDTSAERLSLAQNNAKVYGLTNIIFNNSDFRYNTESLQAETVFLDPPWGGPEYKKKPVFTLADFSPHGQELLTFSFEHYKHVIFRVPFNFDFHELEQFKRSYKVKEYFLEGRLISRTAYFNA